MLPMSQLFVHACVLDDSAARISLLGPARPGRGMRTAATAALKIAPQLIDVGISPHSKRVPFVSTEMV